MRIAAAAVIGVALLVGSIDPVSGADDEPVAGARGALAARTADRQQAEQRVGAADAALIAATTEVGRLGGVDAELTAELTEARRELREYAVAAYIDGGRAEVFRSTLSMEQAQALSWQSNLLLGQSVSADEAAGRYVSLKAANEPAALTAATAVDSAEADLQDARYDLIQAAAFERDAEAELTRAIETAEREAAARREAAAQRETAARRAADEAARASVAAPADPAPAPAAGPAAAGGAPAPPGVGGGQGGGVPLAPATGGPSAAESATLARIRACESRGNYSIVSRSGRYRGAYQFDFATWRSVGGAGDPAAASPAEQDYRALLLLRLRGTRPWPVCGR